MISLSRNAKVVSLAALATALLLAMPVLGQHPGPQPRPGPSFQQTVGDTTYVTTPEGQFPAQNPFTQPPGSNFLLTDYRNAFDGTGAEMPNTLPSHPDNPWNLHVPFPDGSPVLTTPIDPTSPSQLLHEYLTRIRGESQNNCGGGKMPARGGPPGYGSKIDRAIDVLEGNPMPAYVWSGFPLLHYTGPLKVQQVTPLYENGVKVGGNVDVHQVWYDGHIESDTALLDPSTVPDVPWTITYTVDCLHRCHDDFAPFVMYFDAPPPGAMFGPPHVAMDQTFFPMADGTRNVFKLKMAPGKYYNLTYTWGWRVHPPRVQVSENSNKMMGDPLDPSVLPKTLLQWEIDTFGPNPRASDAAKLAAIGMIGDLAPAKRMWNLLRQARTANCKQVAGLMDQALVAYDDWFDRTELPTGAKQLEDPNADITLLYVNNTIYGKIRGGGWDTWFDWQIRPQVFKVTLFNGDHFVHGYMNVDFGGSRGWENQFVPTVDQGATGCKFSFGRTHWWINAGGPWGGIGVAPVDNHGNPGMHKVELTLNFEPSRRLRLYQFDPLHHDVAVFSIH
jgi:hypothetical protein